MRLYSLKSNLFRTSPKVITYIFISKLIFCV